MVLSAYPSQSDYREGGHARGTTIGSDDSNAA